MATVRVLVVRAAGINCDEEVMHCWRLVGASPTLVHLNRLCNDPAMLDDFQIVTIPGGFSYGDDIAAGVIFAQRLTTSLVDPLRALVKRGGGVLGICNGFQILVKAGLLPGDARLLPRDANRAPGAADLSPSDNPDCGGVTVTYNDSARFEARWVRMQVCTDRCPFLTPGAHLEMPVEHAEGKVVTANSGVVTDLEASGRIALRYVDPSGAHDTYPANPNGSDGGIAGLCDATGRVLGLMPHPDRNFDRTHHPQWTSRPKGAAPDGLSVFANAVAHWS